MKTIRAASPFWALQVGGWFAFGAAISIGRIGEFPLLLVIAVDWTLIATGFLVTLALRWLYSRLGSVTDTPGRVIGVAVVASYLGAVLWTAAYRLFLRGPASSLLSAVYDEPIQLGDGPVLDNAIYSTVVLVAWSVLYFGIKSYQVLQQEKERALRAEAQAKEAQLQMLAYQLNPHFLFNALNSLRALIDEDRTRARAMVTELAGFLRYALVERPLQLARFSEELDALRGYLAIERIRFEDRLDVVVSATPETEDCLVPAFLLHPLVENAIKHGSGTPLRVRLYARSEKDRLRIKIENTGSLSPRERGSAPHVFPQGPARLLGTGIGLRNVRTRLQQLFPGDHTFEITGEAGWVRVSIDIPFAASLPTRSGGSSDRASTHEPDEGETRWAPAMS